MLTENRAPSRKGLTASPTVDNMDKSFKSVMTTEQIYSIHKSIMTSL